jgi:uncharacterized membrane protein YeaQ/YmgE (transglycosylase-associated protein family)
METIVWIVTGIAVGWFAFSFFKLNEARGQIMSMVIGAIGALVGGKALAPILVAAPLDPISVASVAIASAAAAVLLLAGNAVQNRWNV